MLFLTLLCVNVYGYDIRVDKQGWSDDEFHWEMITDTDKYGTGMSGCGRGLKVNGIIVIPCQNYAMDTVTIGNSLYFKVKRSEGEHYELFDIVGERVIPFKFDLIEKGGTDGNLDGLYEFCTIDNGIHRQHLCDSKFNLIKSGYDGYAKRIDVEGYNGYFITIPSGTSGTSELYDSNLKLLKSGFSRASDKKIEGRNETYLELTYKDNGYEQELYTTDMKMVFPRYRYLWQKNDSQGNFQYWHIEDCYGHKGRLDKGWNWIVSLDKGFSEIYEETISGVNYYKCKRGDYWGLFDTKFNEVIPPDYEDLDYFAGTNYVKFKLNGFWGVMTLQGKVTKTIIPTTRGYTDISRYVKSQKRFTYEMNGYKGECNHLGQQVSKIKVNTPTTTTTSTSNSTSSSKSSSSSFSDNSSSDSSHLISFDYFKNPAGTKIKGKYTFTIEFKSDAVYFKLTNKKNGSSTTKTIYNFKLKELAYSATNNNIMVRFREGNKSHAFLFKKGYYDPVEHVETNLTTKQRTVTSYHQERENAHSVILSTLLFETTPTELFYDRLFEELSFYNGGCKIKLIDE